MRPIKIVTNACEDYFHNFKAFNGTIGAGCAQGLRAALAPRVWDIFEQEQSLSLQPKKFWGGCWFFSPFHLPVFFSWP